MENLANDLIGLHNLISKETDDITEPRQDSVVVKTIEDDNESDEESIEQQHTIVVL